MAGMPACPGCGLFCLRCEGIPPVEGRLPTENQTGWSRMLLHVAYAVSTVSFPSLGTCPSVPSNAPILSAKNVPDVAAVSLFPNPLYMTGRDVPETFRGAFGFRSRPNRFV